MRKNKKDLPVLPHLTVTAVAAEGKCLARHEDMVVFLDGDTAAPGDVVDVRLTRKKKNFAEGVPVAYHQYSDVRTEPFCQHFGVCGGCKWQHITYEAQLGYKHQQVVDSLTRIAKVALPPIRPILPSARTTYYRNKLEFTFSSNRWLTPAEMAVREDLERSALGFHVPRRFDKIVDVEHCYLQPDPSNAIRLATRDYARSHKLPFYDPVTWEGFVRNLVVRTTLTGEVMVIVQVAYEKWEWLEGLLVHLRDGFPGITSLQYVVNNKGNDTFQDLEVRPFHGLPYITEKMEDLAFRVGPKSFYQPNAAQAFELYKIARSFAGLEGHETVYDLYTGTGTIANFVARQAQKVIGLEYVPMAIADAKVNAQINGIANTEFFAGDIKDLLTDDFLDAHGRPDVVITDPPRAGMDEAVTRMLLRAAPQRIVYVSCNPATQARDLAILDAQYAVKDVQPVDMFPHTYHVENVVLLERRDQDSQD
jgi:23S rRNA (uracil1939-C5)-methyltransferase